MSAHAEPRSSTLDTAKLVLAVILLVVGIAGFYYLADQLLVYRILGVVAFAIAAILVVFSTAIGKTFLGFLRESRVEVRRVVWPTRQETIQATLVVVALVFIVGLFLWLLDMVLFWGVSQLTGQGA